MESSGNSPILENNPRSGTSSRSSCGRVSRGAKSTGKCSVPCSPTMSTTDNIEISPLPPNPRISDSGIKLKDVVNARSVESIGYKPKKNRSREDTSPIFADNTDIPPLPPNPRISDSGIKLKDIVNARSVESIGYKPKKNRSREDTSPIFADNTDIPPLPPNPRISDRGIKLQDVANARSIESIGYKPKKNRSREDTSPIFADNTDIPPLPPNPRISDRGIKLKDVANARSIESIGYKPKKNRSREDTSPIFADNTDIPPLPPNPRISDRGIKLKDVVNARSIESIGYKPKKNRSREDTSPIFADNTDIPPLPPNPRISDRGIKLQDVANARSIESIGYKPKKNRSREDTSPIFADNTDIPPLPPNPRISDRGIKLKDVANARSIESIGYKPKKNRSREDTSPIFADNTDIPPLPPNPRISDRGIKLKDVVNARSIESIGYKPKKNRSREDTVDKRCRSIIRIPCPEQEDQSTGTSSSSSESNSRTSVSSCIIDQKPASSGSDVKEAPSISKVLRKKSPDNAKVIPFSNDDSGIVPDFDTVLHEDKDSCNKSLSFSAAEEKVDNPVLNTECRKTVSDNSHEKGERYRPIGPLVLTTDMIVSGVKATVQAEPSKEQEAVDIEREDDEKILESLKKFREDSDSEVKKLSKELQEANNMLVTLQKRVMSLEKEKNKNQSTLNKVKEEYRSLLEEKFNCQRAIAAIKRNFGNSRIKDRRVARELEQLNISFERLDHQEKLMKRQIAMLEAELALVVSKLDVPKAKKGKTGKTTASAELPKLDGNRTRSLSQVNSRNMTGKNRICRKVPKEILSISTKFDDTVPPHKSGERTIHSESERLLPLIDTQKAGSLVHRETMKNGQKMRPTEGSKPGLLRCNDKSDTLAQLKLPEISPSNKNLVAPHPPTQRKKGKYIPRQRVVLPDVGQSKMNLSNRQ